jgi:hypothetical protein
VIESVEDSEGRVVAYIEYSLVNDKGILDDNGTYIFARRLWIWKQATSRYRIIRGFIKSICEQFPKVTHGYWKDRDFNGPVKTYNRKVISHGC